MWKWAIITRRSTEESVTGFQPHEINSCYWTERAKRCNRCLIFTLWSLYVVCSETVSGVIGDVVEDTTSSVNLDEQWEFWKSFCCLSSVKLKIRSASAVYLCSDPQQILAHLFNLVENTIIMPGLQAVLKVSYFTKRLMIQLLITGQTVAVTVKQFDS